MALAHGAHHVDVPARLDLELDALVAERQVAIDPFEERVEPGLDAEADADRHPLASAAQQRREGHAAHPRAQVGERELEAGARHGMALEGGEPRHHVVEAAHLALQQRRCEEGAHDVPGGVDRFIAVERVFGRDDLAPAGVRPAADGDQAYAPLFGAAEAGFEGFGERQRDLDEFDRFEVEGGGQRYPRCNTWCSKAWHCGFVPWFAHECQGSHCHLNARRNEC